MNKQSRASKSALEESLLARQSEFYGDVTRMDLWYRLVNCGVSRHEIGKKPIAFLFDMYKQNRSQTTERIAPLDHRNWESQPGNQFPDLSQFANLEPLRKQSFYMPCSSISLENPD